MESLDSPAKVHNEYKSLVVQQLLKEGTEQLFKEQLHNSLPEVQLILTKK